MREICSRNVISAPTRRICSGCCGCAASGGSTHCGPRNGVYRCELHCENLERPCLRWVNLDRPDHPSTVSYPIDQLPNRKLRIA